MLLGGANVLVEVLLSWDWVSPDLLSLSLELCTDLLLHLLEVSLGRPSLVKDHALANLKWVTGLSDGLDLILGSVGGTWIGHGVTMVSVSESLEEEWTILLDIGTSPLDGLSNHEDVLGLNLEAWDLVSSLIEVGVQGSTILGSSHSIGVILTEIDDWKLPKTSHVGSLEQLSLVGSTISIHGDGEVVLAKVLLGEGKTSADWHLGTNDAIASKELVLGVVVVHGASLASMGASGLAHHLGKDAVGGVTSGESLAVITVGCDESILTGHGGLAANCDGLLTIVQVAEASDLSLLVELVREDLESTHDSHLLVVVKQLLS